MLAVENRQGDGGGVDHEIHDGKLAGFHYVAHSQIRSGRGRSSSGRSGGPAKIQAMSAARLGGEDGIVQGEKIMDEVAAQKAGRAGQQNSFRQSAG